MNRSHLSLAAQLLIAGTNSLARTNFIETSTGAIPLNKTASGICFIGENDDNQAGGQQDQSNDASNAQQGNPSDDAVTGGQQQEQQSDSTPQPNSSTAEVKTESSETGSQDAGGEQEQQS